MDTLLFERLTEVESVTDLERVTVALDQVLVAQMTSHDDVPAGVLNFGVRRAPDVQANVHALHAHAEEVRARIEVFEPRLRDVAVQCVAGELRISARYGEEGILDLTRR